MLQPLLALLLLTSSSTLVQCRRTATLHTFHLQQLTNEQPINDATLQLYSNDPPAEGQWLTQKLDHFNHDATPHFQQRYYHNPTYYKAHSHSPVFLYIGGEGELGAHSVMQGEIVDNARIYGADIYGIEHRYYGKTQPTADWSTSNLQYLTSRQALADVIEFIAQLKHNNSDAYSNAPFITFGGSYPGALSGWLRLQYPHVITASLASSAPVRAKRNFFEYDQGTQASLGTDCVANINSALSAVEEKLQANEAQTFSDFGCSDLYEADHDAVELLYALADSVSYAAQYTSHRDGPRKDILPYLCDTMADTSQDAYARYKQYFTTLLGTGRLDSTCIDFASSAQGLGNITVDHKNAARQWYWQSCNEFGYFQASPPAPLPSTRSRNITVEWHEQLCDKVFKTSGLKPNIDDTNAHYGGGSPYGSRVAWTNGLVDPWHMLGITTQLDCCSTLVPIISDHTSHCADLYSPAADDPQGLTLQRQKVTQLLGDWLDEADTGNSKASSTHSGSQADDSNTDSLNLAIMDAIDLSVT